VAYFIFEWDSVKLFRNSANWAVQMSDELFPAAIKCRWSWNEYSMRTHDVWDL